MVRLGLGLGSVSGWLMVMHTHLNYFLLSLSRACEQEILRPQLFMCGWPAYRGRPVMFVYTVLEIPDRPMDQQHSIRFAAREERHQLTKTRRPVTTEWLEAMNVAPAQCLSINASLADVRRQHQQLPVVGNFTRHTFNVTNTYEVYTIHVTFCVLNCPHNWNETETKLKQNSFIVKHFNSFLQCL